MSYISRFVSYSFNLTYHMKKWSNTIKFGLRRQYEVKCFFYAYPW